MPCGGFILDSCPVFLEKVLNSYQGFYFARSYPLKDLERQLADQAASPVDAHLVD